MAIKKGSPEPETMNLSDSFLCVILERENLALASDYLQNLYIYTQLKPENISIAKVNNIPKSLEKLNTLIFDISQEDSQSIALIEKIKFDGDIVVFTQIDLSTETKARISAKVSDILIKPINWKNLKDKNYLS